MHRTHTHTHLHMLRSQKSKWSIETHIEKDFITEKKQYNEKKIIKCFIRLTRTMLSKPLLIKTKHVKLEDVDNIWNNKLNKKGGK